MCSVDFSSCGKDNEKPKYRRARFVLFRKTHKSKFPFLFERCRVTVPRLGRERD